MAEVKVSWLQGINVYNEDERKQICLYPFSQLSRLLMDV